MLDIVRWGTQDVHVVHRLSYVGILIKLLGRFIRTYGTHIIIGMAIGGQDVICVRQKHSSTISPANLRKNLEDLGDFLFSDGRSPSLMHGNARDGKQKVII